MINVLFLCTGNSARSILAEALLNHLGQGRFKGFSAGSHPKGAVNPLVLAVLAEQGIATASLRSKIWEEFAGPAAPQMDYIITVCDQAAGETCPVWPGRPFAAHWGLADPAAVTGDEDAQYDAFRAAYRILAARIGYCVDLRFDVMELKEVRRHLAWAAQLPQGA